MKSKLITGICQICGCTEYDCRQCIEKTGEPCSWTDETEMMCTACQENLTDIDLKY